MFRMKVTTNYKFRVFEKGKDYEDKLIPVDVFERWLERKLAKNIEKEISQEENLIEEPRRGRGRPPKKNDNFIIQSDISSTEELPGNN